MLKALFNLFLYLIYQSIYLILHLVDMTSFEKKLSKYDLYIRPNAINKLTSFWIPWEQHNIYVPMIFYTDYRYTYIICNMIMILYMRHIQSSAVITWCNISWYYIQWYSDRSKTYCQISNIMCTLVGSKIADHSACSDVVGASPLGTAPTASSFSN